jgi:hypothetical protein
VTDPISRQLLQLSPETNATVNGAARFVGSAIAPVNIDQWTGDVSHNAGASDMVHGYYAFQRDPSPEPTLQLNHDPGFWRYAPFAPVRSVARNETHVFSQRLVNEARFGFNRINITFEPNLKGESSGSGESRSRHRGDRSAADRDQRSRAQLRRPLEFLNGRTDTTMIGIGHGHAVERQP